MKLPSIVAILVFCASPSMAHTGLGDTSGFAHGLAHPIFGVDHLLAMVAVGLWSGFILPGRCWAGAAAFLSAMVLGAGLSWAGVGIPMVESWIVLSVVVFGLLTLTGRRGQPQGHTRASLAAIALFALCHGHAHATEATGNAFAYLGGFLLSTSALHLVGIAIARSIAGRPIVQRVLGAGVAVSGLFLMVG